MTYFSYYDIILSQDERKVGAQYMNLPKLKGIMREKNRNYIQCANSIGKSVASFNKRMNGQIPFSIVELEDLGNYLGMTDGEKAEIFLH